MNFSLIKLLLIALITTFIGCASTTSKTTTSKEYAYLAPYVLKDKRWQHDEWVGFIQNLTDKHLCDLALDWGVLNEASPGINTIWSEKNKQKFVSVGNTQLALSSLGGKKKTIKLLRKEVNNAYKWLPDNGSEVEWHKIVRWAASESGVNKSQLKTNTFDIEKALITQYFEKSWAKLNLDQRKSVIENSKLSSLSAKEKSAMIMAGSGAAALAALQTTVAFSGFAFYTTMSSVMAATANVVGVTLPFAVYTGASTSVGSLTGPIGWSLLAVSSAGLGLYAIRPDEEKVTRMVISLHILKVKALNDSNN